ncbi:MAG: hypothetical protein WCG85_25505 [Polyangia bacterium]
MPNVPSCASEALALPAGSPSESTAIEGRCPAHSAPKFPHRRVFVLASWRSAHAWIEHAYPSGLDAARPDLTAKFPELVANIDHLEQAAEREATTFENVATASPDAFTAALRKWEAATLDGLAALNHAQLEASPGHQLDLREVPRG